MVSRQYTALASRASEEYPWDEREEGIDGTDDIVVVVDMVLTALETVDDVSVEMENQKLEEV